MAAEKPGSVTVRTYDVGFGDSYLLSFHYPTQDRHVLIDFGSMEMPAGKLVAGKPVKGRYLNQIAKEIARDCGGKLDVVVATHRHEDHISGFARSKGKGPGEIIRSLNPRIVLQPWTEDPDVAVDATGPTQNLHKKTLMEMQALAAQVVAAAARLRGGRFEALRAELQAIGLDNIKNLDAVENLESMAKNRYLHFGRSAGLSKILPGVKVTVLGPPTVAQTDAVLKQRDRDPDEFWHLNASYWRRLAVTAKSLGKPAENLFAKHPTGALPRSAGWFRYSMMNERADSLLSIVRMLDDAMNNTSLILLFEAGGKKLLFPGDAQYENWMHALGKESVRKKLATVNLYKVGHHGSLNATPKTLWKAFAKKGGAGKAGRLQTLLSTKEHVHGSEDNDSEVPRGLLVTALETDSALTSTLRYSPAELSRSVTLPL